MPTNYESKFFSEHTIYIGICNIRPYIYSYNCFLCSLRMLCGDAVDVGVVEEVA